MVRLVKVHMIERAICKVKARCFLDVFIMILHSFSPLKLISNIHINTTNKTHIMLENKYIEFEEKIMYFLNQNADQIENLKKHLKILDEYKWIYDFQVTQLFTSKILETHFPESVGEL